MAQKKLTLIGAKLEMRISFNKNNATADSEDTMSFNEWCQETYSYYEKRMSKEDFKDFEKWAS